MTQKSPLFSLIWSPKKCLVFLIKKVSKLALKMGELIQNLNCSW
jgi:hypothetical protein